MTGSKSIAYSPYIGVYVTLDDSATLIREQVGFETMAEYREWVGIMRETYPNAQFACFRVESVSLIAQD